MLLAKTAKLLEMKQVLQNIKDGTLSVKECPAPVAQAGKVVIANAVSVISAGTEKMVMDLAGKSLLAKAKERPDHVRRVLEKVRNEGLLNTVRAVREKLDEPMTMGYSSAGTVLACGAGVDKFKPGDRVASNGSHAEVVSVPSNLCASVPDGVTFDHAAFGVLGAIALQGVRLSQVQLGETVFVIGLGLVGQLAVNLLNAAGCRVIGTDLAADKCELALKMGAAVAQPGLSVSQLEEMTGGVGADAVLITASTKSNGPIDLAAGAVRQRGRVVLVGVVGLELDRRPFYFKEAEFVVSCSYGPGRYDPNYEELGQDYPIAHVRWTEQRNIQAVLQLMGSGQLGVAPLVSHRFRIDEATAAYDLISSGSEPFLGVLLHYDAGENTEPPRTIQLGKRHPRPLPGNEGTERAGALSSEAVERAGASSHTKQVSPSPWPSPPQGRGEDAGTGEGTKQGVGVLGAGNFARIVLIPQIVACDGLTPTVLCSAGGVHAAHSGEKHGFRRATTDEDDVFSADDVNVIFSITQHNLHANHVIKAIRAGKHIFVEKPLCLNLDELADIEQALLDCGDNTPVVMVGFNRRFAPLAQELKSAFDGTDAPLTVSFRFNAGTIPEDHWTQLDEIGGGRIIGEACHAIDFAAWLTGSVPVRVYAESIGGQMAPQISDDQCFITIRHHNGSISNIAYLAGGDKACPKERIEVFGGGRTAILDDFRQLTTYRGGRKSVKKHRQDKGHAAEIDAFAAAVAGLEQPPISWPELRATTMASILAVQSLREGIPFIVPNST